MRGTPVGSVAAGAGCVSMVSLRVAVGLACTHGCATAHSVSLSPGARSVMRSTMATDDRLMSDGARAVRRVVARADENPLGTLVGLVVEDTAICLVRAGDGCFYALRDNCTHEDYPLSDGELDDFTVECARHGSRFDIRSGAVLNPPAVIPVETLPVEIVDGDVAVWVMP